MKSAFLNDAVILLLAVVVVASAENRKEKRLNTLSDHRQAQELAHISFVQSDKEVGAEAASHVVDQAAAINPEQKNEVAENKGGEVVNENELGLRFNKFKMYADYQGPNITLTSKDYPLSDDMAHTLSYESSAYSVVTYHDFEMIGHDIEHYIEAVGGYPPRPTNHYFDPYWHEFKEVVKRSRGRQLGNMPPSQVFVPPRLWEKFNVTEVAEAVHNEVRTVDRLPVLLLAW